MKIKTHLLLIQFTCVFLIGCSSKVKPFEPKVVYESNQLQITQLTKNTFIHCSYKQTQDFGNVPCNGLIVRNNKEVVVFDTPTNNTIAEELLYWLEVTQKCKVNAVIPTHFHDDCLGGLDAFKKAKIPSYGYSKTVVLAQQNHLSIPQFVFNDSLQIPLGNTTVVAKYFGPGHTQDNIVAYFAEDKVLFGGCLIKEINANKGYLGDADVKQWSATAKKVKNAYSNVKWVVPGHGAYGDSKLLDYTITLFAP